MSAEKLAATATAAAGSGANADDKRVADHHRRGDNDP